MIPFPRIGKRALWYVEPVELTQYEDSEGLHADPKEEENLSKPENYRDPIQW